MQSADELASSPRIVVFGNLLSPEECDALIAAAAAAHARSLTVATKTGGEEMNADRTSDGMFFQRGESAVGARPHRRAHRASLLRWPIRNGEGLQVLPTALAPNTKPTTTTVDPPGQHAHHRQARRAARGTLVMYLHTPKAAAPPS